MNINVLYVGIHVLAHEAVFSGELQLLHTFVNIFFVHNRPNTKYLMDSEDLFASQSLPASQPVMGNVVWIRALHWTERSLHVLWSLHWNWLTRGFLYFDSCELMLFVCYCTQFYFRNCQNSLMLCATCALSVYSDCFYFQWTFIYNWLCSVAPA